MNVSILTNENLIEELVSRATDVGLYSSSPTLKDQKQNAEDRRDVLRAELMKRFLDPKRFMTTMILAVETGIRESVVRVRLLRAIKEGVLINGIDFVKMGNVILYLRDKALPIAAEKEKAQGRPRKG